MKKLICFLVLLIPLLVIGQTFEKFTQFGGTGDNKVTKSIMDDHNNLYIVGNFSGTIDVEGTPYTTYGGSYLDAYVSKYDTNGNLIWFKQIGCANLDDYIDAVTLSPDNNLLYIAGGYKGTSLSCGDGFTLTNSDASGTYDAFLLSINTSSGIVTEAKNIAYGPKHERPQDLKVDKDGNLVILGFSQGDTYTTYFNTTSSYINDGIQNYFIAQLNSSNLEINWVKHFTGNDGNNKLFSLDVDNNGYYIAGTNKNTLNLDVKSLSSDASSADMFLYKTDFNGNGEWVRSIKGSGNDVSVYATCDQEGHIYISGYYASADLKVDSTATLQSKRSVPNKGGNDIFFAKYDTTGNLVWFDVMGSSGDDRITRLSNYGRYVVIAGQYTGSMTIGGKTITPKGGTDALGLLFNKEYNFFSPISIGGSGTDVNQTCVIGNNGKFYFIGQTNSPITYFTATDSMVNATPSTRDVYIAKYGLELTNNEPEVVVENPYRFKSTVTVDSLLTADSIATQIARVDTLKFNDGTSMSTASTGSTITASDGVYMDGDTVKLGGEFTNVLLESNKTNNESSFIAVTLNGSLSISDEGVQMTANDVTNTFQSEVRTDSTGKVLISVTDDVSNVGMTIDGTGISYDALPDTTQWTDNHAVTKRWVLDRLGSGNNVLNDTIFDVLSSHLLEIEVEPGDGTYYDYTDTMGVALNGYYRYRDDYYPEGGGPVESTVDSTSTSISVKKSIKIRSKNFLSSQPELNGYSYIEMNGNTAYFATQDSTNDQVNPSYFSQFSLQPQYAALFMDNYTDEYGSAKGIVLSPDSITLTMRSGYEFPSADIYTTFKEDGMWILNGSDKVRIGVQISGSLTDGTPTAAQLNAVIGLTAIQAGKGYQVTVKDSDGTGLLYKVESDGTDWHYIVMTKAL